MLGLKIVRLISMWIFCKKLIWGMSNLLFLHFRSLTMACPQIYPVRHWPARGPRGALHPPSRARGARGVRAGWTAGPTTVVCWSGSVCITAALLPGWGSSGHRGPTPPGQRRWCGSSSVTSPGPRPRCPQTPWRRCTRITCHQVCHYKLPVSYYICVLFLSR